MADYRNRISITLSDAERAEIDAVAGVLGIKSTRVVYECVKAGLTNVLESGQMVKKKIEFAQHLQKQLDWTNQADLKKSDKPKTFQLRKAQAKKKKSR